MENLDMTIEKAREIERILGAVGRTMPALHPKNHAEYYTAYGFIHGWEAAGKMLLEAVDAKEDLLACYRVGKRPSDALWKRLEKANADIENFRRRFGEE